MFYSDWESVIGLEIHAQLLTRSKIFSPDSASYGGADNEHVHPVSLGMPGTLPVLNKRSVEYSVRIGLALGCEINRRSVFARKNYFYPDLAKGYQISQFEQPLCLNGEVQFYVGDQLHKVKIERAHMEEDAGKSIHQGGATLVNYNRAGVPLLEIVSSPDMRTAAEAAEYARMVRLILRYIDVCDGNLEEGSMRCDCNVSVRKKGDSKLGTKVELKNLNSFRFIEKAIDYEIQRQIDTLEAGDLLVQETRLYDSVKNCTRSMRSKEEARDYRYFPDPDILPLDLDEAWVEEIGKSLPELPLDRLKRFHQKYGLPLDDAQGLIKERGLADFFEEVFKECGNPRAAANWVMVELLREMRSSRVEVKDLPVSSKQMGELIKLVESGKISGKMGKTVFHEMWKTSKDPKEIIKLRGMEQISDKGAIDKVIEEVLVNNQKQVEEYCFGKEKVFSFFVGQIMKITKGQANPKIVNRLLKDKLRGRLRENPKKKLKEE